MSKFKVGEKQFETKPLRGREGRTTMNYVLKKISTGTVESLFDLTVEQAFLTKHLPVIVDSKEDAKYIDENASTAELISMINGLAEEVGQGFESEEVGAALKNSEDPPVAEE